MVKFAGLLENANAFFEAAKRCGFDCINDKLKNNQITKENEPLYIPKMVNISFACELYLKAIEENKCGAAGKGHNLYKIFEKFPKEIQKEILNIWRGNAGENIIDCDYTRKMFFDNLKAISNVFTRFRYANEWVGSSISLQNSFTSEQFKKFSPFSTARPLGSPQIHDGFIEQFAVSLRIYTGKLLCNS